MLRVISKSTYIMFVVGVLLLSACDNSSGTGKELQEYKEEIRALKAEQEELLDRVLALEIKNMLLTRGRFAVGSTGSSTIEAEGRHPFLVALNHVEKCPGGYCLTFDFGNPSLVTYHGLSMVLQWGQAPKPAKEADYRAEYEQWEKTHRKKYTTTKEITPGKWNMVTVMIPADEADLNNIFIQELVTHSFGLKADSKK